MNSKISSLYQKLFKECDNSRIIAFDDNKTQYTHLDFKTAVANFVSVLETKPCCDVALYVENAYLFLIALTACFIKDKHPVMFAYYSKLNDIEKAYDYDLFVTDQNVESQSGFETVNIGKLHTLGKLSKQCSLDVIKPFESDRYMYLYTSGSTGKSKKVKKDLLSMEKEAFTVSQSFKEFEDLKDVCLYATIPPYHLYGLSFRIFLPVFLKIPVNT
ncbi:MAG: hypothetical protein ACI4M9_01500, partial [Succinivibrio sp.]